MGGGLVEPISPRWTTAWTLQQRGEGGQGEEVSEAGRGVVSLADDTPDASSPTSSTDLQSHTEKGLGQVDSPHSTARETENQGG